MTSTLTWGTPDSSPTAPERAFKRQFDHNSFVAKLSQEALARIYGYLSAPRDIACLSLTCTYLLMFGYSKLQTRLKETSARWAGGRLICIGDYTEPKDLPLGMLTNEEKKELNLLPKPQAESEDEMDVVVTAGVEELKVSTDSEEEQDGFSEQEEMNHNETSGPQGGTPSEDSEPEARSDPIRPRTLYEHVWYNFKPIRGGPLGASYDPREADLDPAEFDLTADLAQRLDRTGELHPILQMSHPRFAFDDGEDPCTWVLCNLSKREFVKNDDVSTNFQGRKIGLGHCLLARISWSSQDHTAMSYENKDRSIHRGVWAGDRFMVTTLNEVMALEDAKQWKDVTEEVSDELDAIWESAYGTEWVFRKTDEEDELLGRKTRVMYIEEDWKERWAKKIAGLYR